MPTREEILQELQQRRSGMSARDQAVLGEIQRRVTEHVDMPEFRTDPAKEAITEAFPTSFVPRLEQPGEVGAFVGEVAGQAASIPTGPWQPITRPVFGAAGAALGGQVERFVRGEPFDMQEAKREALLSFLPEAGESVLRGATRQALRITRGGHELREAAAAQIAEGAAKNIFNPPGKAQVNVLFDVLDQQHVGGPLLEGRFFLESLEASERTKLTKELKALNPHALAIIEQGGQLSAKQMQDFRSLIGQQAEMTGRSGRAGAARTQQLLWKAQEAIETDLDALLNAVNLPGSAQTAREAYHRQKAAERMNRVLTTSPVTKSIKGGDEYIFDIDRFHNAIKDNKTREIRAVNRDLTTIPGAQEEFDAFFRTVKGVLPQGRLVFTDTSGLRRYGIVGAADRMISQLITSPIGRTLFRDAIVQGRGTVSMNSVAVMLNIMARQDEQAGESLRSVVVPQNILGTSPRDPTVQIPPNAGRQP
jgi:hypothetical protein